MSYENICYNTTTVIAEYNLGEFKWIDVHSPNKDELRLLNDRYGVSYQIINDLEEPISDTRITKVDHQIFFTFHLVSTSSIDTKPHWYEVDFIVSEKAFITVSYGTVPALDALRDEIEIEASLKREMKITLDQFIYGLLYKIHRDLRMIVSAINSHLQKIDHQIFAGSEKEMVREISKVGRLLFRLNQSISEQKHVIKFFPQNTVVNEFSVNKLLPLWERELEHTSDQTAAQYNLYHDLRRTNEELLATRQNEVMKKLTLIAFITSPLTIIAGIFGMNTRFVPFIGNIYDFWIIIGLMITTVFITVFSLKYRGWFN